LIEKYRGAKIADVLIRTGSKLIDHSPTEVSLEPLVGMVYTNWVFPNQLGVMVKYNSELAQTTMFSMAT